MKYYLVALFDAESYNTIETIQKNICKNYKTYKNMPTLHILLETIDDPDIDKLYKITSDILKPYRRFKIKTNETICFEPPYKSINLKVENKGYIIRIARSINDTLKLHGFNVRENIDNLDLHVSLANIVNASKELSNKEYVAACSTTKNNESYKLVTIEKIELWKLINNKKEVVVKSFPLRNF